MVFRISLIMFLLLLVLGGGFTKMTMYFLRTISNINSCETMMSLVSNHIDGELERIESVMKTAALNSANTKLTPNNSRTICENIRKTCNVDTAYVAVLSDDSPSVANCLVNVRKTGKDQWSEPHYQPVAHGIVKLPVVTFVTPLRDAEGNIYAVLCGDMRFNWLRELARNESRTEKTSITVESAEGLYLCHPDSSEIMKHFIPEEITEEERGANMFLVKEYQKYHDPRTSMNRVMERTGWKLTVSIPFSDKSGMGTFIHTTLIVLFVLLFAIIVFVIIMILRWQLRPLRMIADAADAVSKGDFDAELPTVHGKTDIRHLRDSFERMQTDLKKYIEDLRTTTEKEASMQRDLQIAANIQRDMIPQDMSDISGRDDLDIFGILKSAREVGGDLFDCFIRDEKLLFCLGDVSGKGVPASLLMTVIGHLFRNIGQHTYDPKSIVEAINIEVARNNEQNMFCTLFVGVLDLPTGMLSYCNAGHNPPVYVHDGKVEFMQTVVNIPVGAFDEFDYIREEKQLSHGDVLFLYSDGVTEAENPQKDLFGDDRTLEAVARASQLDMKAMSESVRSDIKSFVKDAEQSDDLTILCLRYE